MDLAAIYVKTPKGRAEINSEDRQLTMALRRVLILVDGRTAAGSLIKRFGVLGDMASGLDALLANGYIEPLDSAEPATEPDMPVPLPSSPPATAPSPSAAIEGKVLHSRAGIARLAYDALGPDSATIIARIERAPSAGALLVEAERCRNMIGVLVSSEEADRFWQAVEALRA